MRALLGAIDAGRGTEVASDWATGEAVHDRGVQLDRSYIERLIPQLLTPARDDQVNAARMRGAARQLRAAVAEVDRLIARLPNWDLTQALQQRDALIAQSMADQEKIRRLAAIERILVDDLVGQASPADPSRATFEAITHADPVEAVRDLLKDRDFHQVQGRRAIGELERLTTWRPGSGRVVELSDHDVRLLRGIRGDAASWQQSHGERLLLDRLIAEPEDPEIPPPPWRRDAPPRGVRCLVTVRGVGGLRVTCAKVSPDHEDVCWFSDGVHLRGVYLPDADVVAWMPAPDPALPVPDPAQESAAL